MGRSLLGIVAHAYHPGTQKVEAALKVKTSLGYITRLSQKSNNAQANIKKEENKVLCNFTSERFYHPCVVFCLFILHN
jgi:hypothetical protein